MKDDHRSFAIYKPKVRDRGDNGHQKAVKEREHHGHSRTMKGMRDRRIDPEKKPQQAHQSQPKNRFALSICGAVLSASAVVDRSRAGLYLLLFFNPPDLRQEEHGRTNRETALL